MKNFPKFIITILLIIVAALCIVLALKINCRWGNKPNPIPPEIITKRLVPFDTAKNHQAIFNSICGPIFKPYNSRDTVPYSGSILRNTDVLLSLGLNNADLYDYVQCEQLRLKTMLGYDMAGKKINLYAHPVEVQTNGTVTTIVDLAFDKYGNLYYAKTGTPWKNPCKEKCIFSNVLSASAPATADNKKLILDEEDMYVIDLNNPCPPCN